MKISTSNDSSGHTASLYNSNGNLVVTWSGSTREGAAYVASKWQELAAVGSRIHVSGELSGFANCIVEVTR